MSGLVTTEWLEEQMKSPDWKEKYCLLDCTWDLPKAKRNFQEEHNNCRIPGAKLFDLNECRNKDAKLPNTVPSELHFVNHVKKFPLSNAKHVILYDNSERFGLFSAPRVWWLFNVFGHSNVSIVDGGLPKWKREGRKIASGPYTEDENFPAIENEFKAAYNADLVKDLSFMKTNFEQKCPVQVLDARPNGRFRGVEPEPRPDIPSGHMPLSISIPFFTSYNMQEKVMFSTDMIKSNLTKAAVDLDKPIVSSCGSGITASALLFALFLVTGQRYPLFDDSWFGWQTNTPNTPEWQLRENTEN